MISATTVACRQRQQSSARLGGEESDRDEQEREGQPGPGDPALKDAEQPEHQEQGGHEPGRLLVWVSPAPGQPALDSRL